MMRRFAAVATVIALLGSATIGTAAVAGQPTAVAGKHKKKKKKKPKIAVGTYSGTTSDGIQMSITLNGDRKSGSITYCALTAPFTVTGVSFSVFYTEPIGGDTINASGSFNAKTRKVSGNVAPNGCNATPQTFLLQHP